MKQLLKYFKSCKRYALLTPLFVILEVLVEVFIPVFMSKLIDKAFEGIETLLFISSVPGGDVSRLTQHQNIVSSAKDKGVRKIIYTSLANAADSKSILAPDHQATESLIIKSKMPYVILRNNWYLENEEALFNIADQTGTFIYAAKLGRVGWALREEYAKAAFNVLTNQFSELGIFELSGKPLSYAELAHAYKDVSSKRVTVQALEPEAFKTVLSNLGVPQGLIDWQLLIQNDIDHQVLNVDSQDFERILKEPLKLINAALKAIVL